MKEKNIFEKPQPISGGNSYETYERLKTQKEIATNTITTPKLDPVKMEKTLNEKFKEYNISPYYLLQYEKAYYVNTIDYEISDAHILEHIIKMINCAFLYGRAGIFIDDIHFNQPKIYSVSIESVKIDFTGEIIGARIGNINNYLHNQKEGYKTKTFIELDNKQVKNLIIFKWGSAGLGAWITQYPFMKQINKLLKMLWMNIYGYTKKYSINLNDPKSITKELDLFFGDDPFIFNAGISKGEFNNRITSLILDNVNSGRDFIDIMREFMKEMRTLFGRRTNDDEKAERNTAGEVGATQEQYNAIQADYKNEFKLFAMKFNGHPLIKEFQQIQFLSNVNNSTGEVPDGRINNDDNKTI